MSRVAEIILVVNRVDDPNVEDLTFWLGTPEAVDADAVGLIREVAGQLGQEGEEMTITVPLDRVGNLMPLNGAVGKDLWGGFKSSSASVWGGVISNMAWDRFLARVSATEWSDPERVQLLIKDDGDTYFRMYMFQHVKLRNMVPPPGDGGCDRPW